MNKAGMTRACLLLPAIALATACAVPDTRPPGHRPTYPAANLRDDTWEPGPGWTLAWSDEFDGATLDPGKWRRQVERAGRFNEEWQRYTDRVENAYIEDGCLVIKAIHEGGRHASGRYTSARLHTLPEHGWQYGKIAARIQLPYGKGIWPAFWMLGSNVDESGGDTPWPRSGEIDILEMYGSRDNAVIEVNTHYEGKTGRRESMGAVGVQLTEGWFADSFHVFELEWDAAGLRWFVDGRQFASTSIMSPELSEFHHEFFILLNIAVGGRVAGPPDDSTGFPQTMYVDWVRVYRHD